MSTYYGLDFSERNISSVEAEQAFPILDAYVRKAHTSQISKFSSILQFAVMQFIYYYGESDGSLAKIACPCANRSASRFLTCEVSSKWDLIHSIMSK